MYSEWLVEKPADFEQEWLAVICPWGKRNLVIASRVCNLNTKYIPYIKKFFNVKALRVHVVL